MHTAQYLNYGLVLQDVHQLYYLILRVVTFFSPLDIFVKGQKVAPDECVEGLNLTQLTEMILVCRWLIFEKDVCNIRKGQ
jgi:hypothetical protein